MKLDRALRSSPILAAYTRAEIEILSELSEGYKADPNLPDISRLRRRAQAVAEQLRGVTPEMVEAELRKLATIGSEDAFRQALLPTSNVPTAPAIALITGELTDALRDASRGILRTTDDVYRAATQSGVAESLARGETRAAGRNRVLEKLVRRGVTGFTDAADREWNLTSYVDMAVRTAKLRSYRAQHTATLKSVGINMVMIHGGNDMCELCRPWTNKVLSLDPSTRPGTHLVDGATGGVVEVTVDGTIDTAIDSGLEHPNCRCTRVAYLPGVTKRAKPRRRAEGEAQRDMLRRYERQIREAKRAKLFSDDPSREQRKIRRAQARIRELTAATGLERDRSREQIK